jgi:hypothetical protein
MTYPRPTAGILAPVLRVSIGIDGASDMVRLSEVGFDEV